jgi:hydrogenase expression/formation protein HypE
MPNDRIILSHGSGGKLSHDLVESVFLPLFDNDILGKMDDSASFALLDGHKSLKGHHLAEGRMAFTTDSFVVNPIFFPGGDIGRLAICGTVNDLSMVGAIPLYLSAAFILEEGFPISSLRRIVKSMARTIREAGVKIVTGDTKVIERHGIGGLFINTAGVGLLDDRMNISGSNAQPGDAIILSGTIGDHGIAVLAAREKLFFGKGLRSDAAPLNNLVKTMTGHGAEIHAMRDPTRGGLATTLNEIAGQSNLGIRIIEERIPVHSEVAAACEILGYDPLYVANEGKLVACVAAENAEAVVEAMKKTRYGRDAAIIGEVIAEPRGRVVLKTRVGGTRIVAVLTGEMLPRIC